MVPDYKESDGRVSFFWNDFNFYGIVAYGTMFILGIPYSYNKV